MTTFRAGFHVNSTGGHRGAIGDYMRELDAAGIPFVINAVEDAGLALEAAQYTNAPHVILFHQNAWSGAPDYNLAPDIAAMERWQIIEALMPPELVEHKDRIIFEVTIEPDKNHSDWIGRFMIAIATIANADGYAVGGPSFSAGEPEPEHWRTPGMLDWLRYGAPLTVHEYSLNADDIQAGAPWLIGRYQQIYDACDEHDIERPYIVVTECGWAYNALPDNPMPDIDWLARQYGEIPFCLWTLGSGQQWGSLPQRLSAYVDDVTQWMLDNSEPPDEPDPDPDPDPVDWRRAVWEASLDEQQARGITLNPEHALERLIYEREDYVPVHREITHRTPDGAAYGLMAAEHLGGAEPRIVLAFRRPWSGAANVQVLTEGDVPEPEPEPFAWRAWPTEHKRVTQTVGNNEAYYGRIAPGWSGHEGCDVRAPMGSPVYSVDAGVVSDLRQAGDANHPYGRFVRVRYEGGHEVTYAHLDSIAVEVGQQVAAGQVIAHADNTGNIVEGSSHLHVTLKKDNVIVDPTEFILPWKPDFPGLPPAAHGLTVCDVSQHQGAIDFHKMMRRGALACYIRGSIGGGGMDARFAANWQAIAGTPMKRGIYHLFRSDSTARRNLDNLIGVVNQYGAGDMRIAVDVEPVTNLPRVNGDRVSEFLRLFEDAFGYRALLYTGLWVLSRTDGDRSWILHPHLWLASYWQAPPQVGQFPQLPIGGDLSKLAAHQWTSAYYDGRKWGVESLGLDVNVVYDLGRLLVTGGAPEPPPDPAIDMATYFLPRSGDFGDIVILANNWGEGDERQQLQRDGDVSYVTKNQQWERRHIGDDVIRLDLDTSPGNNEYYVVESATGWMPRHWRPGETFTRQETARFYRKGDCSYTGRQFGPGSSDIAFAAHHALYTTRGGITFENVAEIHWIRNGQTEEKYWYAGGHGLIAWWNRGGRESWATEVIPRGQQGDNVRETGCWQ